MQKHVVLMAFTGGNASSIAGPLEVLRYASERLIDKTPISVTVASKDGSEVTCDDGVNIIPTSSVDEIRDIDLVFLAGMPSNIDEAIDSNSDTINWIRDQHAQGTTFAAVCPTQALLAHAGLTRGKSVNMHWSLINDARRRWPSTNWTADRMVVEDTKLYSCCGAAAAIDLTLHIIEHLCGRESVLMCAQWFQTGLPGTRQHIPPAMFGCLTPEKTDMARITTWIHEHYHESINFEILSSHYGMSWRTFYRHFLKTTGDSPKVYLQKLRLNAARHMLETNGGTIDQICERVGYSNPAFFRMLFKRYIGMTPSCYRKNYSFRYTDSERIRKTV